MSHKRGILAAVLCAVVVLLSAAPALRAQDDERIFLADLGGPYIRISIGDYWWIDEGGERRWVHGSFGLFSQRGDPETPGDDDRQTGFSLWKIKVGDEVLAIGDSASGSWSKLPVAYPIPPAGLGLGKTGGFIEGVWVPAFSSETVKIEVMLHVSIVRDQVRFEITARNVGSTPQSIGLEVEHVIVSTSSETVNYPMIPGRGVNYVGLAPERVPGMLMSGSSIPDQIDFYDDLEKPATVVRATLGKADCVKPDYLATADHYEHFYPVETWIPEDYTPDPMFPIETWSCVAAWSPKAVAASGGSRKVITYTGVGAATARWANLVNKKVVQDYAVLAIQGPDSLKYDSTQPSTQNDLSPQPFTVSAYVYNLDTDPGPYAMENATAVIYLPRGLELEPGTGNTAKKVIGPVPINSESEPVSWKIRATGEYCGELEYSVSVSDPSGWQQTVARKILVPATKRSVFRFGWQLMHVPFHFSNPSIDHVFGLNWGTFGARYWDPIQSPILGTYPPITQIEPGKAFWMFVGGMDWGDIQPLQLAADAAITGESLGKQHIEQYVELQPGWNMIGNPLVYPVYWGQVQVYNEVANITVSLDQAVANDWLSKTLFAWNPEKWVYDVIRDNDVLLNPWKGYWVRAKQPVTLVFRPPVFPESDVTTKTGGY